MGTATGLRISSVNGTAFLDNCPADILAAVGAQVKIYDSSNRYLLGYVGAVGSSEGLDAICTDPSFDDTSKWTKINTATVSGGQAIFAASNDRVYQTNTAVLNALYKATRGAASGSLTYYVTGKYVIYLSEGVPKYYTSTLDSSLTYFPGVIAGSSATLDSYALEKVTAPSSSGVTILDAIGGAQNFVSKDASFTYNAASYSYEIISGHPTTKRFGAVPFCTQRRNIW